MSISKLAFADNLVHFRHSPTAARSLPACRAAVVRLLHGVSAMAYRKPNGKWVAILFINGRRTTRSFSSRSLAESAERPQKLDRERVRAGVVTRMELAESAKGSMSIALALEAWGNHLEDKTTDGKITAAWATELHRGAKHSAELLGLVAVNEIHDSSIARLIERCETRDLSAASTVKYVQALRELHRFTLHGSKRVVRRTERRQQLRAFTVAEIGRLLGLDTEHRLFYLMTIFSGVRWRETARIEPAEVDAAKCIVHLGRDKTKSKRGDPIPLASIIADELPRMVGQVAVFGKEPTRRQFLRDLAAAGIEKTTSDGEAMKKSCRKTFATMLAQSGVEGDRRKRLMRHIDGLVATRSYTDRMRLMPQMRRDVERMVSWYRAEVLEATG